MDRAFVGGLLKDWGIALAIVAVVFVGWNLLQPRPPSEGLAPDFELEALDGTSYTLSQLQGKPVVLNFWATWCGPCRAEIPALARYRDENPDVVLLGISVDEQMNKTSVTRIAERLGATYPILHDPVGRVSGPYHVTNLPTTFVIGEDGTIRNVHMGALSERALERLVSSAR